MWKFRGQQRPSFAIEPSDGQESVWDYPRPPKCVDDARTITVRWGELEIAKSTRCIRILETASPPTMYIPPSDVNLELFSTSVGNTFCEWKGAATYWSLHAAGPAGKHVGWSYDDPSPSFVSIKSYLSFYPGKIECYVDGERVRPQPGGFYGGWITNEIVGPCKGEPGTGGW